MLRNLIIIVLVTLTLTGCASLGTNYAPPSRETASSFGIDAPGLTETEAQGSPWWSTFEDPVLESLISEALENNLDLEEAVARVEATRAYRSEARQAYLPGGNVAASQQHLGVAGERTRTASAGIEVGWEIDLFGRIRSLNQVAVANAEVSESLLAQTRIVVAAEVARTWFALQATEGRLDLLERYHADQLEIVSLIETRFEEGLDDEADLARARTAASADALALAGERHNQRALRNALAVLLGRSPLGNELPSANELGPLTLRPIEIDDPASLLQRRPDVRAAERRLAAETAEIGIATSALFPQLSLGGFFGYAAGSFGDLGSTESRSWIGGPTLTWGIFDLGRVRAQIRRERAEAEGALAAYERTVLRALEDTANALSAFAAAQESLEASDAQVRNARVALDLVGAQYEEGIVAYFDLLDARRTGLRAEIARVESLSAHRAAVVDVFRALGTDPGTAR